MNIHKVGMLHFKTMPKLVLRGTASHREASRGKTAIFMDKETDSSFRQIKILLDVSLLFGALGSLDEGLMKSFFVKTSNSTKIYIFTCIACSL